jgi:hypothetical protein
MNARIERAMNSENLGARIIRNGALDQKICALEACRGKIVFLGGSRVVLEFLEWLAGLWCKRQDSCGICGFFGVFGVVFDLFVNIFRNQCPCCNFYNHPRTTAKYTPSKGAPCKFVRI